MPEKEIYHILSNTHWDREWYQSHEKYLVRLVELFDRLVAILEEKPDYRFITDGQFALIDDYLAARPEMRERVKALIKKGQLLAGPWYTQPLENIVGGEALIRNLKYGIKKSEELGGAMRFSYEIDEFGHASQMPQIYNGFDIHGAMAWRGNPKNSKSVYEWQAPDGSAVNMFYSRSGYGFATTLPANEDDFDETIDGVTFRRRGLKNRVNALREYSLFNSESSNMFWLNGIDHSWAQADLLEVIEKIRALFPDIEVKQSTPTEFAEAVLKDYEAAGKKPECVKGELLYTFEDILESTNALHPRQKKRHYDAEKHLVDRFEPLAAFAWLLGEKYPDWSLERAWKYVLENHAHDSLGCCSVDEVFEQVMARYGACISLCEQAEDKALRYIMSCADSSPAVYVFNLSPYNANGARRVSFDIPAGFCDGFFELTAPDGKAVDIEVISQELCGDVRYNPRRGHPTWGKRYKVDAIIDLPEVKPYGWVRLDFNKTDDEKRVDNRRYYNLEKVPGVLENEYFSIRFNQNGTFDLTDKRSGCVYPSQLLFEDTGEADSVYVHCEPQYDRRRIYSADKAEINCLYDTPRGAAYEISTVLNIPDGLTADRKHRAEQCKPLNIKCVIALYKGDEKIHINIHIENRSRYHRLRVLFPSCLRNAEYSAAGQPFDHAERIISVPFDKELPREQDYPTKPCIDYCCVAEDGAGLGVAAKGIYEYECTDDNARALALTLLRCVEDIDTATFAVTPEYKCREAQNLTAVDYELALIPYDGTNEALFKAVAQFCKPLEVIFNRAAEDSVLPEYVRPEKMLAASGSFIDVKGATVTAIKRADDRNTLIVRLLNNTDTETAATAALTVPNINVKAIYENTLEEKRTRKICDGGCAEITLGAHKLLTLEFEI